MTVRRSAIAAALLSGAAALTACGTTTAGVPVGGDKPRPTANTATVTMPPPTTEPSSKCDYRPAEEPADGRDVGLPGGGKPPKTVTLVTNHGEIPLTMATDDAPCTTASIAHLATSGFYDNSPCHRLTKAESLSVLQCGDPTGQGTGGPGYTLPDENPTNLEPTGTGDYVKYPRGTVAMANTGQPHSGGSQFFLVYADSVLPPTYAVFAKIDSTGLTVLDKIAKDGVSGGGQDGPPSLAVTIERATTD